MSKTALTITALAVAAIWILWAFQGVFVSYTGIETDIAKRGQWGDTFGSLNALFAAAAFIGVLTTLRMQAKELADQQDQMNRSDDARKIQRFEDTFFQLLGLLRQLKQEISISVPGRRRATGHDAQVEAARELLRHMEINYGGDGEALAKTIAGIYSDRVHNLAEDTLGPYFRIVYTILRRVSENEQLDPAAKAKYGNLLRSQLSSPEISLIAANGLTEASNDFRKYLEEFRLLKYLPEGNYRELLKRTYKPEAFSARD